jgi:hypothetical protein
VSASSSASVSVSALLWVSRFAGLLALTHVTPATAFTGVTGATRVSCDPAFQLIVAG